MTTSPEDDMDTKALERLLDALRVTRDEIAKTFARRLQIRRTERQALEAYINGASPELTVPLMPHERAVVHFVRSRADGIDGAEKAKLVALAKKDAVLSPLLTDALEHWP